MRLAHEQMRNDKTSFQRIILLSTDGSDDDTVPYEAPPVRSPKTKNASRKLVKSVSKYTNFIFNSAPKLLKKIKGYG